MGKFLLRSVFCMTMIALASSYAHCGPFSDLRPEHWAYRALQNFKEKGIIKIKFQIPFYQDTYLSGTKPITRYEATLIVAMLMKERLPKKCFSPMDLMGLRNIQIFLPQYLRRSSITKQEVEGIYATIDKLAVEFKDELAAFCVKVSNAETFSYTHTDH